MAAVVSRVVDLVEEGDGEVGVGDAGCEVVVFAQLITADALALMVKVTGRAYIYPVQRAAAAAESFEPGSVGEGERPELRREVRRVHQPRSVWTRHQSREPDGDQPVYSSTAQPVDQGKRGSGEECVWVGALAVHRGRVDRCVVAGGERGDSGCISDVTSDNSHILIGRIAVSRHVTDNRRDLVPTHPRFRHSLPTSPAAGAENYYPAHFWNTSRWVDASEGIRTAGYLSGTWQVRAIQETIMTTRQPLPADLFDEVCPSSLLPFQFGDKWAALVIRCLVDGPRRFSELRVPLRRVSPKVLTQSLRNLERDGFVSRTVRNDPELQVEYALTPLGRSMVEPIAAACAWAAEHWDELLDARERSSAIET